VAEARKALHEATRTIDEWTRERYRDKGTHWSIQLGAGASWPISWQEWLKYRLFYREAKLLIDGAPPPEDWRLKVLRARAFAGLGSGAAFYSGCFSSFEVGSTQLLWPSR
jgi:hypothetical protein